MRNKSLMLGLLGVFAILLATYGCGSGGSPSANWKAKPPSNPGTAEQLGGTLWTIGGENTIAFEKDGSYKMGAGGMVMPVPGAKWSIENGVVTVTANDRTLLTATFDGEKLVVNGVEAKRVTGSQEQQ